MNQTDFYHAFEERYRGSRELIKSRLQFYRPFVAPLLELPDPPLALDLGCGRGEWLESVSEWGFIASGVDLNAQMLQACLEHNLMARQGDALAALHEAPEESLALVSAFHLVEHIPYEKVQELIEAAQRALRPGGLLILETPNPENLIVGTNSFYLDPTHVRPVPPTLLAFTTQYAGFTRNKVIRLQEPSIPTEQMGIDDLLRGVSPDYSVVAQKVAGAATSSLFDPVFAAEHGNALGELAQRYDRQLREKLEKVDMQVNEAATRSQKAETEIQKVREDHLQREVERLHATVRELHDSTHKKAEAEIQKAREDHLQREVERLHITVRELHDSTHTLLAHQEALRVDSQQRAVEAATKVEFANAKVDELKAQIQAMEAHSRTMSQRADSAEQRAALADHRVQAIHASRSWKATTPLRVVGTAARKLRDVRRVIGLRTRLRSGARSLIEFAATAINHRPALRRAVVRSLDLVPGMKQKLRAVVSQAQPAPMDPEQSDVRSWLECSDASDQIPYLSARQSPHLSSAQRSPLEALASKVHSQS